MDLGVSAIQYGLLSGNVIQDASCIESTSAINRILEVPRSSFVSTIVVMGTMNIYWGRFFYLNFFPLFLFSTDQICYLYLLNHPPSDKTVFHLLNLPPSGQDNSSFFAFIARKLSFKMKTTGVTTLILELGDVLLNWSTTTKTTIPSKIIKAVVSSHIWMDFERGRISEKACYECAAEHFGVSPDELTKAFLHSRDTLRSNEALISFLKHLKDAFNGLLKVHAMSNMSREDYAFLSKRIRGWSIFDQVFTSGDTGLLKPDLGFYRHVLEATNTPAESAVFIDDKFENIFSANSLGMHGVLFDNNTNVIRKLLNIFGDPVQRGKDFLARNAQQLPSVTESGITVDDNFAQLLILSVTHEEYCPIFLIVFD